MSELPVIKRSRLLELVDEADERGNLLGDEIEGIKAVLKESETVVWGAAEVKGEGCPANKAGFYDEKTLDPLIDEIDGWGNNFDSLMDAEVGSGHEKARIIDE